MFFVKLSFKRSCMWRESLELRMLLNGILNDYIFNLVCDKVIKKKYFHYKIQPAKECYLGIEPLL